MNLTRAYRKDLNQMLVLNVISFHIATSNKRICFLSKIRTIFPKYILDLVSTLINMLDLKFTSLSKSIYRVIGSL